MIVLDTRILLRKREIASKDVEKKRQLNDGDTCRSVLCPATVWGSLNTHGGRCWAILRELHQAFHAIGKESRKESGEGVAVVCSSSMVVDSEYVVAEPLP